MEKEGDHQQASAEASSNASTKRAASDESDHVSEKKTVPPLNPTNDAESKAVTSLDRPAMKDREKVKGPPKIKNKKTDPAVLETRRFIQTCCARNDLGRAMDAHQEALDKGINIEPNTYKSLLSLCDGLDTRQIHVGTPKNAGRNQNWNNHHETKGQNGGPAHVANGQKINQNGDIADKQDWKTDDSLTKDHAKEPPPREVSLEERKRYAFRVKDEMERNQIPLTENSYTALIKLLCKTGDLDEAGTLLIQAEGVQQCRPKLRMYSNLLVAFCESKRMESALKVWLRLVSYRQVDLVMSEREYLALLQCATHCKDVAVAERAMSELAEDILVPSRRTLDTIRQWFQSPGSASGNEVANTNSESLLKQIQDAQLTAAEHIPSIQPPARSLGCLQSESGWEISEECKVNKLTGELVSGGLKGHFLLPAHISDQVWQEMIKANDKIVMDGTLEKHISPFQGGRKGKKRKMDHPEERQRQWKSFTDYVEQRCRKKKIDVVVDAANVGFYRQNFAGAPKHVEYNQIDWILQHFLHQNLSVLLVLHTRHFSKNTLPREFEPMVKRWSNSLYQTPYGMNDDWFWMHVALYCGPGTLVVTNDEMRDHHFQMLASRSFLRWKDRHQVKFTFGEWQNTDSRKSHRKVILTYPQSYSRRIQAVERGFVFPLTKRGDENRFLDGVHQEKDAPDDELYLCASRIPHGKQTESTPT